MHTLDQRTLNSQINKVDLGYLVLENTQISFQKKHVRIGKHALEKKST